MTNPDNQYARYYSPLMYLGIFFVAAIIGADILTFKLISVFGLTASAALIFFPLTYAIGDIAREFSGGNIVALVISALMNVMVMSKLKRLYKGRHFIIRSLIATFSSEIVYVIIAYTIWFVGRVPVETLLIMMAISMSFKIIFALIAAYPSALISRHIIALRP